MTAESAQFEPGQYVERWYDGWEVWISGTVESVGFLQDIPCARVWLGSDRQVTVCRLDQLRIVPLGGLFAEQAEMEGNL